MSRKIWLQLEDFVFKLNPVTQFAKHPGRECLPGDPSGPGIQSTWNSNQVSYIEKKKKKKKPRRRRPFEGLIGAVMAAAALPRRRVAARPSVPSTPHWRARVSCPRGSRSGACTRACRGCGRPTGQRAPGASMPGASNPGDEWRGVPSERRWAMEVLGLRSGMLVERDDVQKRFRRLVRLAHPDHGAGSAGAAERIAELADARRCCSASSTRRTRTSGIVSPPERRGPKAP